jgi:hypothetical protein
VNELAFDLINAEGSTLHLTDVQEVVVVVVGVVFWEELV